MASVFGDMEPGEEYSSPLMSEEANEATRAARAPSSHRKGDDSRNETTAAASTSTLKDDEKEKKDEKKKIQNDFSSCKYTCITIVTILLFIYTNQATRPIGNMNYMYM